MAKKKASPDDPALLRVTDLKPDPHNRRRRTTRGAKMLAESLEQLGPARSIVIDEANEVIAGNGVLEAAAEVGITKVQVVEADGKTLVAVRRRNLTPAEKRALSIYDNRVAELAEWVPEELAADRADGQSLTPWFNEPELKRLLGEGVTGRRLAVKEIETSAVADRFWIAVRGPLAAQAVALQRIRTLLKDHPEIDIELGLTPEVEAWTGEAKP